MQIEVFETNEEAGLGALSTERGNLPLLALDLQVSICGFLSTTTLQQTFQNPHPTALEAVYLFPITDGGAVRRFSMILGDREIVGVVKEREAAQQEYHEAIAAGHQASLAEEERPGLFTLRVGNIPPGSYATIKLVVVAPLQLKQNEATYRLPLTVAPRYMPGEPLEGAAVGDGAAADTDATPDASRISPPVLLPGFPSSVRLSIVMELSPAGLEIEALGASLHELKLEEREGRYLLTLWPGERLDRDLIVRFRFAAEALQSHLLLSDRDQGSFLLTIIPPRQETTSRPRDVLFLLDRSGSMKGWKLVAARRAIADMIASLRIEDRFALRFFSTYSEGDKRLLRADNQEKHQAIERLRKAEANGGTEMLQPLQQALSMLSGDEGRDALLVFVTDGQVGNEDQILHYVAKQTSGARIFTIGVDQAVNGTFLRRLAETNRGQCELVESEERLEEVMSRLHRAMMPAVVVGLSIEGAGLALESASLYPSRLPDVFEETPVQIWGRFHQAGALRVRGVLSDGSPYERVVEGLAIPSGESLNTMWARACLRDLEDQFITSKSDPQTLEKQMVEVSTRFGVVCRFTALLAVDYDRVIKTRGSQQTVMQPVEAPAGWSQNEAERSGARAESVLFSLNGLQNQTLGARESRLQRGWVSLPAQPELQRGSHNTQTRSGTVKGNLCYLSPEQARGMPHDERAEIFVLGLLLFEALTNTHPFHHDSMMQILMGIISQPAPDTLRQDSTLSMFAPIVYRCLEKEPKDRYQSFLALREELLSLQKRERGSYQGETLQQWMLRVFEQERKHQAAAVLGMTISRSFGAYELAERLSEGTHSISYLGRRALSDGSKQAVFLQELRPHMDPEEQNQFMNEVRFVNPGSVEVLEAIQVGTDSLFLAREYVPGVTLGEARRKLRKESQRIPPGVVVEIFLQALNTLREAAALGLHVQELSASTFLLSFAGEVKISSWGAALKSQWLAPRVPLSAGAAPLLSSPTDEAATTTPTESRPWWKFWR